ncbi:MAG: lysophospholipid acyltransferase family protein [Candidatus Omnitrophica bacterium]|nr:lysophospholipid acyltransferase family protein [Candidatus Omnitrophota bacterium]
MFKPIFRYSFALAFRILFRVKIYGRENIPRYEGFIFAGNHVSFLDPIAVGSIVPLRVNFMARHTLFRNPIIGSIISICGSFPVRRGTADIWAVKEAIRRVKNGGALVVFPEGTRSHTKSFLEPKAGIGFLAAKINAPVLPVFVKGTAEALPRDSRRIRFNKVYIYIGKPMRFDKDLDYSVIAGRVMDGIAALAH